MRPVRLVVVGARIADADAETVVEVEPVVHDLLEAREESRNVSHTVRLWIPQRMSWTWTINMTGLSACGGIIRATRSGIVGCGGRGGTWRGTQAPERVPNRSVRLAGRWENFETSCLLHSSHRSWRCRDKFYEMNQRSERGMRFKQPTRKGSNGKLSESVGAC